jgi:hypothetical protein
MRSTGVDEDGATFSVFAPAKVNLALHVLGRRADGYHDLDSIVAFAGVGDWLRFTPASAFSITADGPFASALPEASGNVILKAWEAARAIAAARACLRLQAYPSHRDKSITMLAEALMHIVDHKAHVQSHTTTNHPQQDSLEFTIVFYK